MKSADIIEITRIDTQIVPVKLIGLSPLIVHAWSAKAKREILEKEIGATKTKARDPKNPLEDFCSSMYWLTPMPEVFTAESVGEAMANHPRFGFPVSGIKQAALSAAYRMGWVKDKMSLRGTFFIEPDERGYYGGDLEIDMDRKRISVVPNCFKAEDIIEIHTPEPPSMREDMVRVGMGSADIRYRGQFDNWSMNLRVAYNANGQYSLEQILNIINAGGFACGIGEWRPEKDGQYGQFRVESV